jgi:DMSO/TMAO reductase YedYZ molybdopterin-dependent catalytic subunit
MTVRQRTECMTPSTGRADEPSDKPSNAVRNRRWSWPISGLLAGGFGLAVAELFVGVVDGFDSPIISVGDKAVDLVPVPLKNFAIRTFGTHDKQALLFGIFAAIAVFALVVGAVGKKRPQLSVAGFGLFGVVGALAAVTGRTGEAKDALPSMIAIAAAIGIFLVLRQALLGALRPRGPISTELLPGGDVPTMTVATGGSRRQFMVLAGGAALATAGLGSLGRRLQNSAGAIARRIAIVLPKAKKPLAPLGASVGVPELVTQTPFMTPNSTFYRIDTALVVPKIDVDSWSLRIKGMVGLERTYTYEDLLSRDLVERDITLTCVSNEVGGILMGNARWLGVPLRELLAEAEADPKATQVVGRSVDGWTSGFPMSAVTDGRDTLVAVAMNGEPLPFQHGFPARLIVPGLYGYVSATKWLKEIEVTTMEAFDAYWVPRGYAKEAPIKLASRIDVPRGLSTIKPGKSAVAGVAWSQRHGVSKVEVSIDKGPWQEAELADEVTVDTWRQWRFPWDATPGSHDVAVRAYDGKGRLQKEGRVAPLPNGATGWHSVIVLVAES